METHVLAVLAEGLVFRYGKLHALDRLSLTIPRGVSFGLLGPNGAGKTTLIRVLVGLLKPQGGKALVLGERPSPRASSQIGYQWMTTLGLVWPQCIGDPTPTITIPSRS